ATEEGERGWLQVAQVIAMGVELLPVYEGTAAAAPVPEANATGDAAAQAETDEANEATAAPDVNSGTAITGTVASGDSRLNIRSGPGTEYAIIAKANPGESYVLIGRTA